MAFSAIEDWAKAARVQREGVTLVPPPIEEWQWRPSLATVAAYLWSCERGPWSIDFEATVEGQPVCMAVWDCQKPLTRRGLCIPFLAQGGGQYWERDEAAAVHEMVCDFLTNPEILKSGQNLVGYDTGFPPWNARGLVKRAWDVDVAGIEIDTYALHHTVFCELRHGLAFQASIVTDLSPFKVEVHEKEGEGEGDDRPKAIWARVLDVADEQLRCYCLKDAFAAAMARRALIAEAWRLG